MPPPCRTDRGKQVSLCYIAIIDVLRFAVAAIVWTPARGWTIRINSTGLRDSRSPAKSIAKTCASILPRGRSRTPLNTLYGGIRSKKFLPGLYPSRGTSGLDEALPVRQNEKGKKG
ncbi:hypothetical protein EAI_06879 [Harpegnathos saltator]|uniref:Uncharacterized protein n=1 Tax=Harpegnathos saltator TaxID=610380 RepID=E2C998_HARSA|nr:hypothetical protein EAI_06879 [Harpegnathos saltator]